MNRCTGFCRPLPNHSATRPRNYEMSAIIPDLMAVSKKPGQTPGFLLRLSLYLLPRGRCGEIAQLVEQWPEEPRVLGSIPSLATR